MPRIRRWLLLAAALLCAAPVFADPMPPALFDGMEWRLLGPFRAGWGSAVAGIPDRPDTFYFGAAGGGVWKSDDAGQTWQPIFDQMPDASIGALAIAPSDPSTIYVGAGQVTTRYDIAAGGGVYASSDGGGTWRHVGLEATRHIGAIAVHPGDAKTVLVAALGHAFGPNPERGVYRSTDGGAHWERTLFVDADTGAVDLAVDPSDPKIVFAATWQMRFRPWLSYFTPDIGPGSALFKSTDGGVHWKRLAGAGWPKGALGRIGVAATHTAAGTRVYATIDAPKDGGLYRSDDGGASWQQVNADAELVNGYFAKLVMAPNDPDVVYAMGRSLRRCDQAGARCTIIKGAPGGDDYHELWINPKHPERMITGADQGTVVTLNDGKTWSSWYNQPTGQFYHLAADNRFPYWVYAGQQDSGSVGIASRSDYGAITFRDWHPIGADERDDDIPDPVDPNIVYGSGLGGRLSRWDARTGQVQNITPWPVSSYGQRPTQFTYHYTWITPLAISPLPPHALYFGAQTLFRSTDQGAHWEPISPDLSARSVQRKPGACDGDLEPPAARACGFGVIFNIAPSPRDKDEIWVGTDDGQVHLTRDGGKHWSNITPAALPAWGLVAVVDPAATVAGVAYAAVDNHRQDDVRPHIFRTRDYGKSWTEIVAGLPANHFVSVVRADPMQDGLLYAGTEAGVFVSLDDGEHWQPLQRNLPTAWVRDLIVKNNDLVVATQGRAIWAFDDVSRLRQLAAAQPNRPAHLFAPAPAYRLRYNQNKDTPLPPEEPVGKNPPTGAIIDYWLDEDVDGVLALEIRDSAGKLVRRFASDDAPRQLNVERYFAARWELPAAPPSAKAGAHRFVWNLRHARPKSAHYEYSIAAIAGRDTPVLPEGMLVAPGTYQLALKLGAREYHAPLEVLADPRVALDAAALAQAHKLYGALETELERGYVAVGELRAVRKQIETLRKGANAKPLQAQLDAFDARLAPLLGAEGEQALNFAAIADVLSNLATDVEGSDRAPTVAQQQVLDAYAERQIKALAQWQGLKAQELGALNDKLRKAGLTPLSVPGADQLGLDEAAVSKDLP